MPGAGLHTVKRVFSAPNPFSLDLPFLISVSATVVACLCLSRTAAPPGTPRFDKTEARMYNGNLWCYTKTIR